MNCTERPWGTYEVLLDADDCKVKRITIKPGQKPSYQYHHKRSEHWIVISGIGEVRVDDNISTATSGDSVFVPALSKHTIRNTHENDSLVFIEIQTGEYFGEDDIVRLEDDYGRA
jgi:mannose-6-phosphate isomerase